MPVVTLPDGSIREFDHPVSAGEVVASIGRSLAKATVAARLDGKLVDLSTVIDRDVSFAAITATSEDGLEVIRHSTAHLMAQAVKSIFPDAQVTIGPTVENGFYYDFAIDRPFTTDDLERIEVKMQELARADLPVSREIMPRDQAIAMFEEMGERYKAEIIRDIPAGERISLYRQGEFLDLCRGPHVPSTGRLKAFKLTQVAGAYWRGDSRNPMLQRIYGTAWASKEDLDAYLHRLEEAERRDHRRLGRHLDLFHMQEEAPGMVFWHPHGWTMWRQIEQYMRARFREYGYQEIKTPTIMDRSLWERSGHWDNYRDNMFTTASENRDYVVKPMNCPGHVQIFNHGLHSYRDLPLRLAEFGSCHRNEPSGALHGLMRVRGFVQDDAHIFCTEEQVQEEVSAFIQMLQAVYADFGFHDVLVKLSTRPEKRVGSDESWDKAEAALAAALEQNGLAYEMQPGEGAFYGPKIEFTLKDSIGRLWQCGTIQLDFNLPVRLDAEYVAEDNTRRPPVMLHRAILGSMERFIGILIEHYAGNLPVWLASVQAVVLNITDAQGEYARNCAENLQKMGFRCNADLRNEKIGFKIRAHTLQRVPYLLVVGAREQESGKLAVRTRAGQDLGVMTLEQLAAMLDQQISTRSSINQDPEG